MKSRILYEDKDIIVCHKPAGIATQTARVGQRDMVSEMTVYLAKEERDYLQKEQGPAGQMPYVGVVHRLDQPVEGILVFARNKVAAAGLSRQITEERMEKDYYAVVCGQVIPEQGELLDYLVKDGRTNLSKVVPKEIKGAKEARLRFRVIQYKETEISEGRRYQTALVRIRLQTGRHHQIRVQMANAGLSLLGDRKYAKEEIVRLSEQMGVRETSLCASRLVFYHPLTKEKKVFAIMPEGKSFAGFRQAIETDIREDLQTAAESEGQN